VHAAPHSTSDHSGMTSTPQGLSAGSRVVLDPRTASWRDDRLVMGGSPWRLLRLSAPARDVVRRLRAAGDAGLVVTEPTAVAVANLLVERGFAHPVAVPRPGAGAGVAVVVPAYGRPDRLAACLASLAVDTHDTHDTHDADDDLADGAGVAEVVVVDDASPDAAAIASVTAAYGARLIRHAVNRGPGAARNTGLAATSAPVVAFLDSDCTASRGWLDALVPLFDDPRVAAVAPRVRPRPDELRQSVLARHEAARSALDMGRRRELVRPGAPLGFVPSAALLVRRDALADGAFEPALRLGEDVDLVWRLAAAGWHVRYEPSVTVLHDARLRFGAWARRRYEYGTSAADLDRRHPGRLAPARPSAWNLAALALLAAGRPLGAAAVSGAAAAALGRRLGTVSDDAGHAAMWGSVGGKSALSGSALAAVVVGKGVVADAAALGHALRREWWPLGWAALALAPRSRGARPARAAALAMLAPVALEWVRERPDVDPARYVLLRLTEDAAYGSGVIASAVRGRRPGALLPVVRGPGLRGVSLPRSPPGRR
jgi:mycofactocin system glycosyltransferase